MVLRDPGSLGDIFKRSVSPVAVKRVGKALEVLRVAINAQVARGELRNRGGKSVSEPLDSGLVREDGKYFYPIRLDIPVMLVEEAILV